MPLTFVEKTFADGTETSKSTKVYSLKDSHYTVVVRIDVAIHTCTICHVHEPPLT